MKSYLLFFSLLIVNISSNTTQAQALKATVKYLFIDGESMGEYTGGIHIDEGTIKVGDVLKPKDENGEEFTFIIKEIKDYDLNENVSSIGKGKDGFLIMETLDKKKLAKNPTGSFSFGINSTNKSNSDKSDIGTVCTLDGKEWKGKNYYYSTSYFPNGNHLVNTKMPYLNISFKATESPDDRQFTLIHKEAKVGVGVLDKKNYELLLSGSKDGVPANSCLVSNWKNGEANTQKTDFYFEITKFEDKGDYILLSAKYSGTIYALNLMKGLIGAPCKDVVINNGVINNLRVSKL